MNTIFESAEKIAPIISEHINEEENNRRISQPVMSALRETGLHRLYMPASLGGLETDPLTTAKMVEEIASHNTAAGWSMMVANVSTWWCRWLPEKGIEEIYEKGPDTLIAGAFHPPMMATRVEGGYRINGRNPLASNVHEASWVFVGAMVMENGEVKMINGMPQMLGVFMNIEHCQILDTWHTIGMKATDSNDISANNVFVPDHRSFSLSPDNKPNKYYSGKLYRFAAMGIGVASLIAPVALAVAANAIKELKVLAEKKTAFGSMVPLRERGPIQKKLGMAEALVKSSRAYLHNIIAACWNKTLKGEDLSLEEKADLLLAAAHTNQSCVQAVDMMFSAAGTTGIYLRNKLAHCFSDMQVIRQHGFANESRYETAAQVYFGLAPDLPVMVF